MSQILAKIEKRKREEIARARSILPLSQLEEKAREAPPPRPFKKRLKEAAEKGVAVIAEIKKASPSKGVIREAFDPVFLARDLEKGGAACLSVLTDEAFFQGSPEYLMDARAAVSLPVLRKDFLYDPYQSVEARSWGADAILVIMAALEIAAAREIHATAKEWGMDVLIEVHNEKEMEEALALEPDILGINNRDLRSFETSLEVSLRLRKYLPEDMLIVSESGIEGRAEIDRLRAAGIRAFLIGESLMRAESPRAALHELLRSDEEHDA